MNRLARLKSSHKYGYDFFCLGLLCISGISFCFFLGFPFANHNESYLWLAQLKQMSLMDVITHQVSPVATVRPLGTATAWITYHLTGNIYFQQLINYAFVVSSILLLFKYSSNKVLYAYLSLINGSFFFSGYIYLFHLHGVFYGPFQLYLAFLIAVAVKYRHLSLRMFFLVSIAGLLISLFHTFTLLILICFYLGFLLKEFNYKNIIRTAVAILICITLSKILSPSFVPESLEKMLLGFIATYKSIELSWLQSLIATGLAIIVSLQLAKGKRGQLFVGLATGITAIVLFKFKIPVLFLWILLCFTQLLSNKNWPILFLGGATLFFPVFNSTGSPTYGVFILFVCIFITSNIGLPKINYASQFFFSPVLICLLVSIFALTKMGFKVPGVFSSAKPILAEQEKTFQLERIIRWKNGMESFKPIKLVLFEQAKFPIYSNLKITARTNKAPTTQDYLDSYMGSVSDSSSLHKYFLVTFGDQILKDKKLIYQIKGNYNGNASVYQ